MGKTVGLIFPKKEVIKPIAKPIEKPIAIKKEEKELPKKNK